MRHVPCGTVRGRDGAGETQSLSIDRAADAYIVTNGKHERTTIEAAGIEALLAEIRTTFQLENVEFIPAHGALGAKASEAGAVGPMTE